MMRSEPTRERLPVMSVKFSVNGMPAEFDGPDDVPLLWVVREQLGLTGSKFGCGIGVCGACTMHLDGAAMRTCVMPVALADGRRPVAPPPRSQRRRHRPGDDQFLPLRHLCPHPRRHPSRRQDAIAKRAGMRIMIKRI